MAFKFPFKVTAIKEYDPLTLYHHATYDFDKKLVNLCSLLNLPKDYQLAERFKKIDMLLDKHFSLELLYRLHLLTLEQLNVEHNSTREYHHPHYLLHLWCLLGCTDSVETIAGYLELTVEEVQELIRELHHTFSIESLVSRIRQYYEQNKHLKELPELRRRSELLGVEQTVEPQETNEARKQRLRKSHGHLEKFFDFLSRGFHVF